MIDRNRATVATIRVEAQYLTSDDVVSVRGYGFARVESVCRTDSGMIGIRTVRDGGVFSSTYWTSPTDEVEVIESAATADVASQMTADVIAYALMADGWTAHSAGDHVSGGCSDACTALHDSIFGRRVPFMVPTEELEYGDRVVIGGTVADVTGIAVEGRAVRVSHVEPLSDRYGSTRVRPETLVMVLRRDDAPYADSFHEGSFIALD